MNYTTTEQSKKLVELGLSPETADMYWKKSPILNLKEKWIPRIINNLPTLFDDKDIIPCWSLGALLELMPKEGVEPFTDSNPFVGYGDGQYRCVFLNGDWESSHQTVGDTQIEAAFNMICWLLENGYIKKGE